LGTITGFGPRGNATEKSRLVSNLSNRYSDGAARRNYGEFYPSVPSLRAEIVTPVDGHLIDAVVF
jgi:hypothetical protein